MLDLQLLRSLTQRLRKAWDKGWNDTEIFSGVMIHGGDDPIEDHKDKLELAFGWGPLIVHLCRQLGYQEEIIYGTKTSPNEVYKLLLDAEAFLEMFEDQLSSMKQKSPREMELEYLPKLENVVMQLFQIDLDDRAKVWDLWNYINTRFILTERPE